MFKGLQWMCLDWESEKRRTDGMAVKGAWCLKYRIRQLILTLNMVITAWRRRFCSYWALNYSHWHIMRQIKSNFCLFWLVLAFWGCWFFGCFLVWGFIFFWQNRFWLQQNMSVSKCSETIRIPVFFFFPLTEKGQEGIFTFVKSTQAFGFLAYSIETVALPCVLPNLINTLLLHRKLSLLVLIL